MRTASLVNSQSSINSQRCASAKMRESVIEWNTKKKGRARAYLLPDSPAQI